jgi:hypothetical protein
MTDRESSWMRFATKDPEWDGIWARYDRHPPAAPAIQQVLVVRHPDNRSAKRWFLLALVALALPFPTPLLSDDDAAGGLPRGAAASLSPVEVMLPPLELAVARLAAESASAACWVLQLRPQGGACGAAAAP